MGIHGIPDTQQACQNIGFNKPPEIRTIPTPDSFKPHEMLIKVAAAGLCHSDLEYLHGNLPCELPVTLSHEGTGVVIALGDKVKNFKVGDRALVGQTFGRCGDCELCNGPENFRHYCPNRETMMSSGRNGAFQEYLVIDGREAAHIPDEMTFATAAPLACAGMTAWRAVLQAELKPGQWLGIVGSGGGLGHLAIQFAHIKGLKVVAVDARDDGIALSQEVGADVVLDARKGTEKVAEEAKKATGGGCHATLNLSGARQAPDTSSRITRDHGTIVQVALADPPEVGVHFLEIIFRNIHVKGSFMASQAEIQEMLYAFVEHKVKLENNVFHGLDEIPKALEMLEKGQYRGKGCVVIDKNAPRAE